MEFSVIKKQSEHFAPIILVRFPDGYADRLILWKRYYNEEDRMTNEHADDCPLSLVNLGTMYFTYRTQIKGH